MCEVVLWGAGCQIGSSDMEYENCTLCKLTVLLTSKLQELSTVHHRLPSSQENQVVWAEPHV